MNDQDKKAFDEWRENFWTLYLGNSFYTNNEAKHAWQAACEYKELEIQSCINHLKDFDDEVGRLKAENKKLREALEFYADLDDEVLMYDSRGVSTARETLKEVGEE